jgi:hypothetical protein
MIFFWRYLKTTLVRPLVKMSPNCLTVLILFNWISLLKISSRNQIVLIAYYLLQGVSCGGKILANTSAPKSTPCIETFMVMFPIGRLVAFSQRMNHINDRKQLSAAGR